MTVIKTYKVRLLPTPDQISLMFQSAGAARWAYNYALNEKIKKIRKTNFKKV